jgi:hypothetical protein
VASTGPTEELLGAALVDVADEAVVDAVADDGLQRS